MVENFKKILETMVREKGKVTFFGIMQMDDIVEKWSVILCAPWITEANHDESFQYVFDLINKLDPSEESDIARISIYGKDEHIIQLLLQFKEGTTLENQKVNGNTIYKGYILASEQKV